MKWVHYWTTPFGNRAFPDSVELEGEQWDIYKPSECQWMIPYPLPELQEMYA